jgi:hypothetical protein
MIRWLLSRWYIRIPFLNPISTYLVLYPLLWDGYWIFCLTGRTPRVVYLLFLLLHEQTRGEVDRRLERMARQGNLLSFGSAHGVLGSGPELEAELAAAVRALDQDGYYIFGPKLPGSVCEELRKFADTQPAMPRVPTGEVAAPAAFNPAQPLAPAYDFSEDQLIRNAAVQQLLGDCSLLCLAQNYLRAVPINDLSFMWWSAPFGGRYLSEAAQLFHADIDRLSFLKIFIYLTDVGPDNGPHVYVRGSHRNRPDPFYQVRRFSDEEVASHYPPEDVIEITGPAGTIIAVDTSGLHKGKPLVRGARLILQLEFATSLFGQTCHRLAVPDQAHPVLRRAIEHYPQVFERFFPARQPSDRSHTP